MVEGLPVQVKADLGHEAGVADAVDGCLCRQRWGATGSPRWSGYHLRAVRFSFDFRPDTGSQRPVYLQLADLVIREIEAGRLPPGAQVPGTRKLAKTLGLNRNTVVAAYQDVEQQGYLSARPGAGYYVSEALPLRPSVGQTEASDASGANFSFRKVTSHAAEPASPTVLRITEGAPDVRLADLRPLYATARQLLQRPAGKQLLRYGEGRGDHRLRSALSYYLNVSRGIPTEPDRLLITRGSQHAFQLACTLLFHPPPPVPDHGDADGRAAHPVAGAGAYPPLCYSGGRLRL